MRSDIRSDPSFEECLTKGDKRRGYPASYCCRWGGDDAMFVLEMQTPREGEGFFARMINFELIAGRYQVADIVEVELVPGDVATRSASISHEARCQTAFISRDVLDLIEHAIRKLRPGLYHQGYAVARLDEVRRRLDEGTTETVSRAVEDAASMQKARENLRAMEDEHIVSEIACMEENIRGYARWLANFVSEDTDTSYEARGIECASRRIGMLRAEQARRAALSNHGRLAEAAKRSVAAGC